MRNTKIDIFGIEAMKEDMLIMIRRNSILCILSFDKVF